jgi:hypothetical protein
VTSHEVVLLLLTFCWVLIAFFCFSPLAACFVAAGHGYFFLGECSLFSALLDRKSVSRTDEITLSHSEIFRFVVAIRTSVQYLISLEHDEFNFPEYTK